MSVIHTFDIKACRKTSLNWFFGGFLKFKISKRPRPLYLGPCKDQDHSPVFIWSSSVQSLIFYQRLDLETLLLVLWQAFGASNQLGLNKSHDHVVIFLSCSWRLRLRLSSSPHSSHIWGKGRTRGTAVATTAAGAQDVKVSSLRVFFFFLFFT